MSGEFANFTISSVLTLCLCFGHGSLWIFEVLRGDERKGWTGGEAVAF